MTEIQVPRLVRALIHIVRSSDAEEVEAGLAEELNAPERTSASPFGRWMWMAWQVVMICVWGVFDRIRGVADRAGGQRVPRGLGPLVFRLKIAFRSLTSTPTFTLTAMLTLALGIGATSVMFSIIDGFSRPIPVPNGDDIVRIEWRNERGGLVTGASTLQDLEILRDARTVESTSAFRTRSLSVRWEGEHARSFPGAEIRWDAFGILRVPPHMGRVFTPDDREVAMVSYGFWSEILGADPDVLELDLTIEGRPMRIVGVMPEQFRFPLNHYLWLPLDSDGPGSDAPEAGSSADGGLDLFARLAEGSSIQDAGVEFETLGQRLVSASSARDGYRLSVLGYTEDRGEGGEELLLGGMFSVVILLLIVAVGNSAGVLLARGMERRKAYSLHSAMGAAPRQIVMQSFTESLLLTTGAGILGLGIAVAVVRYINATISVLWGYYWMDVRIDAQTTLFAIVAVAVTALMVGLLPAWSARRADPNEVYRSVGGGAPSGRGSRLGRLLLWTELGVSCIALFISGLIVKGMLGVGSIPEDFPSREVVMVAINLPEDRYPGAEERTAFWADLKGRAEAIPGVRAADYTDFRGQIGRFEFEEGVPLPELTRDWSFWIPVQPSFAQLIDLELLRGREMTEADLDESGDAIWVNEAFANRFFPDIDPVGQRFRIHSVPEPDRWRVIAGVVSTSPNFGNEADADRIFVPTATQDQASGTLGVRTTTDAAETITALRAALAEVDPDVPPIRIATYHENLNLGRMFTQTAGRLTLVGGLGSLLIAVVGLFGMLSLHFRARTRELGVRVALGAGRREILRSVLRVGMVHLLPGLAGGFLFAFVIAPKVTVALYGMSPTDPTVMAGVIGAFLISGAVAIWLPARRAIRVDPVHVLKSE